MRKIHTCVNDVWREENGVEITHSIIHYLSAIDDLHNKNWYSRAVDIANNLWITAGSCSIGLKNLLKKWLIKEDENKFIFLSDLGKEVLQKAVFKRDILCNFFAKKLWVPAEKAFINACKIEHILDDEIIQKLENYV